VIHRHFKGKYYLKLFNITNGDTQEDCVVYFPLYGKPRLFVRTLSDFYAWINKTEYSYVGTRFTKVSLLEYLNSFNFRPSN
jgi:hypothetical protein